MRTILAIMLFAAAPAWGDTIFFRDGSERAGAYKGIKTSSVAFFTDGQTAYYPKSDVLKLAFASKPKSVTAAALDGEIRSLISAAPAQDAYPGHSAVTWLYEAEYRLEDNSSSVFTERRIRKVFEANPEEEEAPRFYYIGGLQKPEILYARSITKGQETYLEDSLVQDGAENSDYSYYDRLRSIKFTIPSVSSGSVTDYKFRMTTSAHDRTFPFYGAFRMGCDEPVRKYRLIVSVPEKFQLKYALDNTTDKISFSEKKEPGRAVYIWEMTDVPAFYQENDAPDMARLLPGVRFALEDDWESLNAFYGKRLDSRLSEAQRDIAFAGRITENIPSMQDKARALYDWVQDNIRYQPVEMDAYSYTPKKASDIMASKAGNVLDKPFLLYALLKREGFKPSLAYSTTRLGEQIGLELPNIRQFAAAAVLLDIDGKNYTLCPYEETRPFGSVPDWLQGETAFVVHGERTQNLFFAIPFSSAQEEAVSSAIDISLNDQGDFTARHIIHPMGEYEIFWRKYRNSKQDEIKSELESFVHDISPKTSLNSYSFSGLETLSSSVTVSLAYSATGYAAIAGGDYMAFQLPGIQKPAYDVGEETREQPVIFPLQDSQMQTARIKLPEGYSVYYLPEDIKAETDCCSYEASYVHFNGTITFTEKGTRKKPFVSPQEYARYRNFRMQIARFSDKWIVIRKNQQ